jgi:uncharacterized protein DUF5681
MPPLTDDDNGSDRDKRGRWRKGNRGGPGGARHAYIRARAQLYEALMQKFSVDEVRALLRAFYNQALDGNTRSAALLVAYLYGKAPNAMTAREMFPAARVTRAPVMSIEAISARLQQLLEDFEAGKASAEEARINRDILSSLAQVKQNAEVEQKLAELRLILERSDYGQPSS